MDLCLRKSLPLLLLAMSFLAMSMGASNSVPSKPTSSGLFGWRGNATESSTDYTKNDLLLGSPDPFFWFLIPLFGLASAGICVIINYAALLVLHMLCFLYSLVTAKPSWLRNDDKR